MTLVLLGPRPVLGQQVRRVGVLASSTEENFAPSVQVFREALAAAGWLEGRNLTLDVRYAGVQYTNLPELAAEMVRAKADVIATLGTPATLAVMRATSSIPIVMESLADAVSSGIIANLARPGGNVTGVSGFAPELNGKRLELVRELVPRAERIAVMMNRSNAASARVIRATESAAQRMGFKVQLVDVRGVGELSSAFDTIVRSRCDAFLVVADPLLFSQTRRIVELAARHRLPAVYEHRLFPEAGGLLSYGPLAQERFARMAVYVDRILRGARPGDLPVEQPTTFELVLNARAAKALGLMIPPSLRARVDQVIE